MVMGPQTKKGGEKSFKDEKNLEYESEEIKLCQEMRGLSLNETKGDINIGNLDVFVAQNIGTIMETEVPETPPPYLKSQKSLQKPVQSQNMGRILQVMVWRSHN